MFCCSFSFGKKAAVSFLYSTHKVNIMIKRRRILIPFCLVVILTGAYFVFTSSPVAVSNVQVAPGSSSKTPKSFVVGVISTETFDIGAENISKSQFNEIISDAKHMDEYSRILLIFSPSISSQDQAQVEKWVTTKVSERQLVITSVTRR